MDLIRQFKNPSKEFSPIAFWFWYGDLKPEKLKRQIEEMVDKGVYHAFMHARAYLKTPYLEQGWWNAIAACVGKGEEIGFFPWLYDEYAWPSGTAGSTFEYSFQKPSRVLAEGQQNTAKSLSSHVLNSGEKPEGNPLAVYALRGSGDSLEIIPLKNTGDALDGWRVEVFYRKIVDGQVDYLNPKAIRSFLNYTHEEYWKRFGKYFGSRIPGIFFDEIYMAAHPLPWTDAFPREFEKRRGYDLMQELPRLTEDGGRRGRQVRQDYFRTAAELYEEAFFKQISDWCEKHNLKLTGHTEEGLLWHPCRQGNYFATMRHLQIPGADNHDYRYRFPRKITYCEPKYAVSVARLFGKKRCMSEAMGGAGWGCSLEQFKRGINVLGAMGISMFTLHGFYYECRTQGEQGDWPASFFYQNPYWKYFKRFSQYVSRVCYMNTIGKPVVDVGLYYPIEIIQAETVNGLPNENARSLDKGFHAVLNGLIEHQIDVDMIDAENLMRADLRGRCVCAGEEKFRALVFPAMDGIPDKLMERIFKFREAGVTVLFYRVGAGLEQSGKIAVEASVLWAELRRRMTVDTAVVAGSTSDLYVSHRRIGGMDFYFVVNGCSKPRSVTLRFRCSGRPCGLDPETGEKLALDCCTSNGGTEVRLDLQEDQACYLLFEEEAPAYVPLTEKEHTAVAGRWSFLPIGGACANAVEATETELAIPLADFTSEYNPASRLIRICNTEGEDGRCGRHLSLWNGAFLTRRPSWRDDFREKDLYFRKILILPEKPETAPLCLAAVNDFEVYVNGTVAASGKSDGLPVQTDIAAYLRAGKNLIAVHVYNDIPLPGDNLCSADVLPKDRLTCMILEGYAEAQGRHSSLKSDGSWIVSAREHEGWQNAKIPFEEEAKFCDPAAYQSMGQGFGESEWLYAWECGQPPLQPWGDLPRFGESVRYPVRLCYGVTIPAGAVSIRMPQVKGNFSCTLDGFPITWENGVHDLVPNGRVHTLNLSMEASGPEDGLLQPVKAIVKPFRAPLCDWRLHGLGWFSGSAVYRNTVALDKREGRYFLDLGQVNFSAEVWVNGRFADVRLWKPYRAEITELLRNGENEITVVVANSAAVERRHMLVDEGMALGWNRYWNEDNIDREGENLVSGLAGPVDIIRLTEEKI